MKITICICFTFFALTFKTVLFAQSSAPGAVHAVKVMTINHAFCCPVLTPRLTQNLERRCNAQSIEIAKDKTFLTFFMADSIGVSADSIVNIALHCGFPPNYITVEIDKKNK